MKFSLLTIHNVKVNAYFFKIVKVKLNSQFGSENITLNHSNNVKSINIKFHPKKGFKSN